MNSRLQVQLNMVGACITVAQSSDYKPAWNGQPPPDFGTDLAQLATDNGAVTGFSTVMSIPRGQIVNRSALLKEVETDVAALLEKVSDMDDLVVQFDGTEAGKRFIEVWKRACIIVDSGGGGGTTPTPPTPPTPPAA